MRVATKNRPPRWVGFRRTPMETHDDLELARTLRALHSSASEIPSGLSARIFQASVSHLPNQQVVGRIGSRTSFQWKAAAAILILAGGAILSWQTAGMHVNASSDDRSLAAVLEASSNSSGDDSFIGLASAQGAGLDDLAFEMRSVLGTGQAGR